MKTQTPHTLARRSRDASNAEGIDWDAWQGNWQGPSIDDVDTDKNFVLRSKGANIAIAPNGIFGIDLSPSHDNPTSNRHDPADIFNRELVDVPDDVLHRLYASRTTISAQEVQDALARSWPGKAGLKLILEDRSFITCDYDIFMEALPHLGTKLLNYLTPKTAGWVWVCRMYSSLLLVIIAAILRIDAACKIDDEEGGHSFNGIVLRKSDGSLVFVVIEPQADAVVLHVDPPHHYTGVGFAVFGS